MLVVRRKGRAKPKVLQRVAAECTWCSMTCAAAWYALLVLSTLSMNRSASVAGFGDTTHEGDDASVGGGRALRSVRHILRKERARRTNSSRASHGASTPALRTFMRLNAVQAFLNEVDKASQTANQSEVATALAHPPRSRPNLVETRRYSGRLQTGCIGGCF